MHSVMKFITKALNTEDAKLGEQTSSLSQEAHRLKAQNHKITLSSHWRVLIQGSFSAKDENSYDFQKL